MSMPKWFIILLDFIKNYFKTKSDECSKIINSVAEGNFCIKLYLGICIFIIYFVIIYIFIGSFGICVAYINNSVINLFRNNCSYKNNIKFMQINNLIHITDWLSFDTDLFIMFILCILYFVSLFYIYINTRSPVSNTRPDILGMWSYLTVFIIISFIVIFIYFIVFYSKLSTISSRCNNILNNLYKYINIDFLKYGSCNYFDKEASNIINPNENFIEGKCNNLEINNKHLMAYIRNQFLEISKVEDITNRSVAKIAFQNVKDENGISYYNKILNAIVTQAIIYYIGADNGKDFFSLSNLLTTNYLESFFRHKINPLIYLTYKDINLFGYTPPLLYGDNDVDSSILLKYIINDYEKIKYLLSNLINDYINLANSLMPAVICSFIIFIIAIILFIINIFNYVSKNPTS